MRFAALNLLAYGHFTDRSLELIGDETDLHLLFGPNEAGKSTARSAIGDFLFGFPSRTALDFRHAYGDLRIGARLETAEATLEAIRKKGRKNTLLDAEGQPATAVERDLERQLAGVDREFFTRMFSLNHTGLREGGRTLAAANANADSALLSAGSGLTDIVAARNDLAREASELWSPNRSANRAYYQAKDRLEAAEAAIREHEITSGDWQRRRDALDTAETHYFELAERRRARQHQWRELERIRRVAQPVRRYRLVRAELAELGETALLDRDDRTAFDKARETLETTAIATASIEDQIAHISAEIDTLIDTPALREQTEAIERLADERGQIAADRQRLVDNEREQNRAAEALATTAGELGWSKWPDRWPSAAAIAEARRLAADAATRRQALEHAEANLETTRRNAEQRAAEAKALGEQRDTATLAAWLAACTREGDLEAEVRRVDARVDQLVRDIERRRAELVPTIADTATLAELDVPSRDTIDDFDARLSTARDAGGQFQRRVDELTDEVERERDALTRRRADNEIPRLDDLTAIRHERDRCWQHVKQRYIERREPDLFDSTDEADTLDKKALKNPADRLERTTQRADSLADRRFAHAEAIARDAERERHLAEREHALEQAVARRDDAQKRVDGLQVEWAAVWRSADITPQSPSAMRDWLDRRSALIDKRADRRDAEAERDGLARRVTEHGQAGRRYLNELGIDSGELAEASLSMLIERARRLIETEARRDDERQRVARERETLDRRIDSLRADYDRAQSSLAEWQQHWRDISTRLGLDSNIAIESALAALDMLDTGREHAQSAHDLAIEHDDRVARLQRYDNELDRVLDAVETNRGLNEDSETTVARLTGALRDTQSQYERLQTREADRLAQRERLAEHEQTRDEAQRRIEALCRRAGVADPESLDHAITRALQRQQLENEQTALAENLADQGDGQPIDELVAAVEASDLDSLRDQIDTLNDELADLETEIGAARDERNSARAAFEGIGGDDRAAMAAAERQTALADMTTAAERYLRAGPAALLLKWAGQRYAIDKQRPLIERGSVLMNHLTGGSFERLTGEFDTNDELQIVGVRPDGARLAPTGMSEGTRDQLYLALRLAAIEDYLQRAPALPVVADDLFINFDDERALAGLEVLASLAETTQVLFFTHHRHLRELAAQRLGTRVTTHAL